MLNDKIEKMKYDKQMVSLNLYEKKYNVTSFGMTEYF
jgi:hypothetical protein